MLVKSLFLAVFSAATLVASNAVEARGHRGDSQLVDYLKKYYGPEFCHRFGGKDLYTKKIVSTVYKVATEVVKTTATSTKTKGTSTVLATTTTVVPKTIIKVIKKTKTKTYTTTTTVKPKRRHHHRDLDAAPVTPVKKTYTQEDLLEGCREFLKIKPKVIKKISTVYTSTKIAIKTVRTIVSVVPKKIITRTKTVTKTRGTEVVKKTKWETRKKVVTVTRTAKKY